jgi:ATP-dependent phosphofructokinase / diphosphate-dependent phosphofructokinase
LKDSKIRRIGILTGGGDCPGLNGVIRAVVKTCRFEYGIDVVGIEDGYGGLINDRMRTLASDDVSGILARGGTILGSSNKDNPFRVPVSENGEVTFKDLSDQAIKNAQRHGLELLIVVGGDGSLNIAYELSKKGLPVVGIPKTIDNDLDATDVTFGFDSALTTATEAADKLHTTADSHHRLMVLELMGRYAGWIALEAGMAGGGDVILIPEIPFNIEKVAQAVRERAYRGRNFAVVVVAEGAAPEGGAMMVERMIADSTDAVRLGGIGRWVAEQLERRLEWEARTTVLGHLQRGGSPTAFDRLLATRFGVEAVRLVATGQHGRMVSLHGTTIDSVTLEEAVTRLRRVDPESQIVQAARAVGTSFGD